MAGGVHKNHETTPAYEGRITAFVVLSCVTAAMGGVIFGYDIGVSGGVTSMEPFLKKFFPAVYKRMQEEAGKVSNYCKFDSQLLTAFTSSLYIAGLVATLLASRITGGAGRRTSMLLGGAAFVAGTAVGGAAVDIYMLILSRLLLGVGLGFANQDLPVGSPACAVPNGPVVVNIPTLGMSLPHGIPFRRPILHGRAYVAVAISGVPAYGKRPSQVCANEHNGKQA
uniref:Major facilitator superfamily (MFS) profile domain-containing protein n=1 Tax=Ananas comosus var. bracteatus TaxID=296719 RepID=A0A6V7Q2K6_ANACO|nr:unnamed protein product [Ananas comosus var. bracteatus]